MPHVGIRPGADELMTGLDHLVAPILPEMNPRPSRDTKASQGRQETSPGQGGRRRNKSQAQKPNREPLPKEKREGYRENRETQNPE